LSLPRSVRRFIREKKAALAYSRRPVVQAARDLDAEARFGQALDAHRPDAAGLVKRGNTKPNPTAPIETTAGKLSRAATDWLRENDPTIEAAKLKAARKARKERRQARNNTKLVGQYRKALAPRSVRPD
jgi:hypothetical protein